MQYKIVIEKTGAQGYGESVAQAIDHALGRTGHLKWIAATSPHGYFWSPYLTRTLGTSTGGRRTVVKVSGTYEICGIYTDKEQTKLLVTVYRSPSTKTLEALPDHGPTNVPKDKGTAKGNRKAKRARSR